MTLWGSICRFNLSSFQITFFNLTFHGLHFAGFGWASNQRAAFYKTFPFNNNQHSKRLITFHHTGRLSVKMIDSQSVWRLVGGLGYFKRNQHVSWKVSHGHHLFLTITTEEWREQLTCLSLSHTHKDKHWQQLFNCILCWGVFLWCYIVSRHTNTSLQTE